MPNKDLTDNYSNLFKQMWEKQRLENEQKRALLPQFSDVTPARTAEEKQKRQDIFQQNIVEATKQIGQQEKLSRFGKRVQQAPIDIARSVNTGESTILASQYNNMKQSLDEYRKGLLSGLEDSKLKPLADKLESSFTPELRKKFEEENKMSIGQLTLDMVGATLFKSDSRKDKERYRAVLSMGDDPQRALQASEAWENGDNFNYTFDERQALLSHDASELAWNVFNTAFLVTDVMTLGATAGARMAVRGALKEATKEAVGLTGRDAIRNVLIKRVPEMKGTQQLETAVEIIERSKTIAKLKDTGEYKDLSKLLRTKKSNLQQPIAQSSVVYQNGIPIIRRANSTVVGDALSVRSEIKNALMGSLEDFRLSNKEILSADIKAGVLPSGTKLDGTVDVYLMGGRRVKNGSQVTPNATIAGDGAKLVKVPTENLVKLSDGTFVNVDKRVVGKDLSAPITQIRQTLRQDVLKKEMQTQVKQSAKELARKNAREEKIALEQARQIAEEKARQDAIAKSNEVIARSQDIVKSAKAIKSTEITASRRSVANVLKDITKTTSNITKIGNTAKEMLRGTTVKSALTPKQLLKKFDKFLPSGYKNKLKKGKDLTAFERKNLAKRIIKERDAQLADARESLRLSQISLRDGKKKLEAIKNTKSQGEIAKETIKQEKEKLKSLVDVNRVQKLKSDIVNAKTPKQVDSVKETAPVNPEVGKTRVGTKIVDSTTISNKLLFEAKKQKGLDVGEKATQIGTTRIEQSELSAKFLNTKGIEGAFNVLLGKSSKGDEFANLTNEGLWDSVNIILRETGQTTNYMSELESVTQRLADIAGGTAQEQRFRQYSIQSNPLQYLVKLRNKMMESKGITVKNFDEEVSKIEKEITEADGKMNIREIISKSIDDNIC